MGHDPVRPDSWRRFSPLWPLCPPLGRPDGSRRLHASSSARRSTAASTRRTVQPSRRRSSGVLSPQRFQFPLKRPNQSQILRRKNHPPIESHSPQHDSPQKPSIQKSTNRDKSESPAWAVTSTLKKLRTSASLSVSKNTITASICYIVALYDTDCRVDDQPPPVVCLKNTCRSRPSSGPTLCGVSSAITGPPRCDGTAMRQIGSVGISAFDEVYPVTHASFASSRSASSCSQGNAWRLSNT